MRLLLILAVVAVVWALVRSVRQQRRQWLQRLALPGTWLCQQDGVQYRLHLQGGPLRGRYSEQWRQDGRQVQEAGTWRMAGNDLEFVADGSEAAAGRQRCTLRLFEAGRIGIDGPGRTRRIYSRQADNVVPLEPRH